MYYEKKEKKQMVIQVVKGRKLSRNSIEETAHVHVLLFLFLLFLLLLLLSLFFRSRSSGSSRRSSGGRSGSRAGNKLLHLGSLEGLGEDSRPDSRDINASSLGNSGDLVGSDLDLSRVEEEGSVSACKLVLLNLARHINYNNNNTITKKKKNLAHLLAINT